MLEFESFLPFDLFVANQKLLDFVLFPTYFPIAAIVIQLRKK